MKTIYFKTQNSVMCILIKICFLFGLVQSLEVFTLSNQGDQMNIIKNDKVQGAWDYKPSNGHSCRPSPTIIEKQDNISRQFTISNTADQTMLATLQVMKFDQRIMNVQINEANNFTPIKSGESKMININYECNNSLSYDGEEGWARVEFSLEIKKDNQSQPSMYYFSLLKICQNPPSSYDMSIFVLMGLSVLLVAVGAYQVESPLIVEDVEQTQEVSKNHAVLFILGGSFFLVIMFFLYEYIQLILNIMILISAHSSMQLLGNDALQKAFDSSHCENYEFEVPMIGKLNITYLISGILSFAIAMAYAFTKNWMISNFIALCIVMLMFKIVRIPSYMIAFFLLGMAFLYDVFWVFYSDRLFGQSVMANVATKVELPMMFYCPKINLSPIQSCSLIGLGDIVLPGIFVSFCFKFGQRKDQHNHYYFTCLGGYILGILLCVICLTVFNTAQPALLYISPCTLIPVAILSICKGEFIYMWKGLDIAYEEDSKSQIQNGTTFDSLELGQDVDQQKHKLF